MKRKTILYYTFLIEKIKRYKKGEEVRAREREKEWERERERESERGKTERSKEKERERRREREISGNYHNEKKLDFVKMNT